MKKRCSKCKETKDISFFGVNRTYSDGLQYICKKCASEAVKRCIKNDPVKRLKMNEAATLWRKSNKERFNAIYKKYRLKNADKLACRHKTVYAIKVGKLVKLPCDVCNDKLAEAHHDDYTKPLNVVWLCKKHHEEKHTN